jgi:GTP-binding protein
MPSRALASLPVVAVVGRPNVGKSTIFNRFVGRRQAIVEDRARTTRDRMYGDMEWNGRRFVIVDTGGLEVDTDDPIEIRVQEQARLAIREADVILFLVDAVTGLTPADLEAAELLRTAKAPVIVAVNKVDNTQREADAAEFWSMGWEETYSISASHGRGTGDLLDAIVWALPPESAAELARKLREQEADEWAREVESGQLEPYVVGDATNAPDPDDDDADTELDRFEGGAAGVGGATGEIEARWDAAIAADAADDEPAAIAFVGRPNVGKSSLLNSLLGEDRAIVSDVPGTTRDAIDTTLEWGRSEITLIDTAGIRRRGKVAGGPAADKYSTLRSLKAIARADVAVLVIDAVEGLTAQDAHVAGYVVEEGRGLVIAVNKWDLVEDKTDRTFDQYIEWIRNEVPFLEFAPIVSISAKTGQRVGRVLELAIDIWGERRKRISTGELNRVLRAASERQTPPVVKGRRPKLFYGTQAAVAPPTFVFFANDAAVIHFSYRRYLENRLRAEFGFDGTPIKLVFRDRASVKLPRRRAGGPKNPVSKGPAARRPASGGQRPAGGGGSRPASGGSRPKR